MTPPHGMYSKRKWVSSCAVFLTAYDDRSMASCCAQVGRSVKAFIEEVPGFARGVAAGSVRHLIIFVLGVMCAFSIGKETRDRVSALGRERIYVERHACCIETRAAGPSFSAPLSPSLTPSIPLDHPHSTQYTGWS
jgi:hypothetical protein